MYWKQKSSRRSKNDRITNATINNRLETIEQRRTENWLLYFSIWFYLIGCWKAKTYLNIFRVIKFYNFWWKSQWKYHSSRGSRRMWKITVISFYLGLNRRYIIVSTDDTLRLKLSAAVQNSTRAILLRTK